MDPKYKSSYELGCHGPGRVGEITEPVREQVVTSLQKAVALAGMIRARNAMRGVLAFVPNRMTRESIETSVKAAIRDLANDIISAEGV